MISFDVLILLMMPVAGLIVAGVKERLNNLPLPLDLVDLGSFPRSRFDAQAAYPSRSSRCAEEEDHPA